MSIGRAILGNETAGPVVAVLDGFSSKKSYLLCLACGHKWKI
nr:MAG TPA: RNA polymerase-like protein [Bacteriophage sp.]